MTDNGNSEINANDQAALAKYDEKLSSVSQVLMNLADGPDAIESEEIQHKLMNLAEQTSPQIKGIATPSTRAKIPILQLMQAMTNSENVPNGAKPGDMYTTSGQLIGNELVFYPIYMHWIRKKWGDDKIECQSIDGKVGNRYGECRKCPYGQFERDVRPQCSPGSSYFLLTEDLSNILQVDFIKTSSPTGRKIKQLALPPALWGRPYILSTEKKQQQGTGKGVYYVYSVRASTERTPKEQFKICDVLYDYFEANHQKAVILQNEYARRNTGGMGNGAPGGALGGGGASHAETALDTAGEPDLPDFSESV